MRTNEEYRLQKLHEACFKDITGQKFGKLLVLGVDHTEGKLTYWKCRCDCGNETVVVGGAIKSGHTKSCGCAHKKALLKDLTGQRFYKLVVESYSRQDGKKHLWNCICDCGERLEADGKVLRAGNRTSCGCARRSFKLGARKHNLTNMRFGRLLAIEPTNHSMWKCKCDCGNNKDVKTSDLLRGFVTSCGCVSLNFVGSKYENEIRDFVKSLVPNLSIEKSKILYNSNTNRCREIDIYIPELKLGIEYNGSAFHTSSNSKFGLNKSKYYHRNKFLQAKKQGIRLISVFDIDYENDKLKILEIIGNAIKGCDEHNYPTSETVITNNDFDDGEWLREFGYEPIEQLEPKSFVYDDMYLVYRCGETVWRKIPR